MTQTTLLEEWLNSPNPAPISLPEFKTEAHKIPVVFEARVKHVSCHRLGIHEYILVHCSVMLPTAQRPIMAHFRLERNPTEKSPRLLSGKSNPAADTIRMSVNTDMLHPKGSWAVRGYFVFNQEDNARQPLKLKHILEMYEYLSQESHKYTIFGTNCRWLCFGLLECLRDCKPCFGGQWFECGRKDSVPKQDTQAAVRAKACYLKEKHAECCNSRPRPSSIMAALVAEATNVGIAVSNMVEIANQAQVPTPTPSPTDPNVIYSTAVPATPLPQQTQLPSGNTRPVHNHVSPQHIPSGMPAFVEEPETIHNEPTMRSPHPPHPPHHHAHTQRQSVSYISSPPVWVPSPSHPGFDRYMPNQGSRSEPTGYAQHPDAPNGSYQHHIPTWSGATGPCSCPECAPRISRSSMMSDYTYPPQVPPNYHHHQTSPPPHPPHGAGGFQHHTAYPRPRPTQAGIGTLYGIPEGPVPDTAPEYNPNRHAYRNSVYEQPPVGCSNCGHHAAAPAPMPQNTFPCSRPRPESTYTQGSNNGFTGPRYQNVSSPTARMSGMQPQHPQPRRWFTQDSTTGGPARTESPTQMSQRTMDDMEFDRMSEYSGYSGQMNMPNPDNYRPRDSRSDLL